MIIIKEAIASNLQLPPIRGAKQNPIRKCRVFLIISKNKLGNIIIITFDDYEIIFAHILFLSYFTFCISL